MVDSKSEVTTRTGSTEVTNLYEIATGLRETECV